MRKQHGFILLEALITVVIVSVALLGIAGLIATSLKVNQGAQIRSQASWLANDIIDRMRANRATAQTGAYDLASCPAPTGSSVAQQDLANWCEALGILPSGTGSVVLEGDRVRVTVQWNDTRAGGATNQQFVMETRL